MSKIKAILFDYDGTLMDTNELIIGSWQSVFKEITGKPGSREKIIDSFGETLVFTMKKFFPDQDTNRCIEIYRKWQGDKYLDTIEMFPGMSTLVKYLSAEGYKLGIVSSRIRGSLEAGLDKFGLLKTFDVVVSCEDSKEAKPSPVPAQIALKQLGIKPEDAIMIGDTKFDIGCANNAGMHSILMDWGFTDVDRTEYLYKAEYVVHSTPELREAIEKIG